MYFRDQLATIVGMSHGDSHRNNPGGLKQLAMQLAKVVSIKKITPKFSLKVRSTAAAAQPKDDLECREHGLGTDYWLVLQ